LSVGDKMTKNTKGCNVLEKGRKGRNLGRNKKSLRPNINH